MIDQDIRTFQHLNKYARFREDLGRRETWQEAVDDRIMQFFIAKYGNLLKPHEWVSIRNALLTEEATFAMRVVQMAGPAMERCHVAGYNCAYTPIEHFDDICDALYILMQGTGCAYSVERQYTNNLPVVLRQIEREPLFHVVEDSTEGWCHALEYGLSSWFNGRDIDFDFRLIRPAGARLVTKGGYASGPGPLIDLLKFAREIILAAQGRKLRPFEVHRIMCKIGKIVEVGGVRRAAMLCLSDLDDPEMQSCKNGQFWEQYPELTMSNNSAVYSADLEKHRDDFDIEWANLVSSGSGERGIFNRGGVIPRRRQSSTFGTNPCGEIILRPRQFCNLSMAIIRSDDDIKTIIDKVTVAAIMGTLQAGLTSFRYISSKWQANCKEEALLGVDLLGAVDNKLLHNEDFLEYLRDHVNYINKLYADRLGIKPAAATTCIKPGGNSSERFGTGNSITGWHGKYILRRYRVNDIDPMCQFLKDQGVPWEPEYNGDPVTVFSFPKKAPEGAVLRSSMSALDQLEYWLKLKQFWCEHNPSTTIFVKPDEWDQVKVWLQKNWNYVGGLAFLPYSDAVYPQQPNEEITEDEYNNLVVNFQRIDWTLFGEYEKLFGDMTTIGQEPACLGGACEI